MHSMKIMKLRKEQFQTYTDLQFLDKQKSLDLLPIDYKLKFTDLVMFHKIIYKTVNITLPNYVVPISSKNVLNTRSNYGIIHNSDNLMFNCTVRPRIDTFKFSFFPRSVALWNTLPLKMRQTVSPSKFSGLLKEHFWTIFMGKPD